MNNYLTSNFGWVPPDLRSEEAAQAHSEAVLAMPDFRIFGSWDEADKAYLWEFSLAVNGNKHLRTFYQKTGSCFPAGTLVQMADGTEKKIEEIQVGDLVISHTGASRKVTNTFRRNYTGRMRTFNLKGSRFPVTVTDDHDMVVVPGRTDCKWRWQPGQVAKVKAREVAVGDRMMLAFGMNPQGGESIDVASILGDWSEANANGDLVPARSRKDHPVKPTIAVDRAFARFVGLYLAEGHTEPELRVTFTYGGDEMLLAKETAALARDIFGVEAKILESQRRENVIVVRIDSSAVARVMKHVVPEKALTKRVPAVFFRADEGVRLTLLRGWMDGDGHVSLRKIKKGSRVNYGFSIRGVSGSSGLIRDMMRLSLSCGMKPAGLLRKKAKHQNAAAMDLYLTGNDALKVYPEQSGAVAAVGVRPARTKAAKLEYGYAAKVTRIDDENVQNLPVYCCEVEVEHTLIVNCIAVGQCVGNGGGQATRYLAACEAARTGASRAILPFYLIPYGRSRLYAGMRGQGEGSLGSTFAKAALEDGFLDAEETDLPRYTDNGGISWGSALEYRYSDGEAIPADQLARSRKRLVKTVSQIKSVDDAVAALCNCYTMTCASDWGGQMRPQVVEGVLLNQHADTWQHQMSIIGYMKHPTLGRLFYILNSWGVDAHGVCPTGAPPGGFWIREADMAYIIRQNEVFVFSNFEGYPAEPLGREAFDIFRRRRAA